MKRSARLCLLATLAILCLDAPLPRRARAQSVDQLYAEAQRALIAGDLPAAKLGFQQVLQLAPRHLGARNYLATIATRERMGQGAGDPPSIAQLRPLVLPSVEFQDAPFPEAIESLRQQAAKVSGDKVRPNLVLRYPPGQAEAIRIRLNLAEIPFLEALRYVCEMAGAEFSADRFGLTIFPKRTAPPAAGS